MLVNHTAIKFFAERGFWLARAVSAGVAAALFFAYSTFLHAQSSPLTVQPSTSRVGVNQSNPQHALDVTGTVKASSFVGNGSQLTGLPAAGASGYGSRGQASRNNPTTPDTQYDLKADSVILSKPSDQSTVVRNNPGTITNNTGLAGSAANGRDQAGVFGANSWVHFYWIWNTLATLSSASAPPTGPTLPSGYTHWSYAGAVRMNATSQLVKTFIHGSRAYIARVEVFNGSPPAGVEQPVIVSSLVPPNAVGIDLSWAGSFPATVNTGLTFRFLTGIDHVEFRNVSATAERFAGPVNLPNVNQQFIFMKDSSNPTIIDVAGYTLPNGGE
jgi:hypothetical protein